MKQKTSITLDEDVLRELDRSARPGESRSSYIERIVRGYFRRRARQADQNRDVERINADAERLNADMAETMAHQAPWPAEE
jgi:metal-responsive CopG/Arc/MetJ family transcriptional regulator